MNGVAGLFDPAAIQTDMALFDMCLRDAPAFGKAEIPEQFVDAQGFGHTDYNLTR